MIFPRKPVPMALRHPDAQLSPGKIRKQNRKHRKTEKHVL